jgi:glycosyltransferase involved in cell wall biosynthesis
MLITVVIATRNRRALLSEAISTVLEQTLQDWELLVVDDASTDGTLDYLAGLQDPRIRVLQQGKHSERSAARNRGLSEARGEFILFLDDDDLLRPTALANLSQALRSDPGAVAATAPCRLLQTNGDTVKVYWPAKPCGRVIWRELLFGWWANSGQNLFRTSVIRKVGGFPALNVCEDRKLWLAVARRGRVCLTPAVAMDYRQHAGQSKPANIDQIRNAVWREFIQGLPLAEQNQARRIRRAAEFAAQAEQARNQRQWLRAMRLQLTVYLLAPGLVVSPLTGRPLWWGLKKAILRVQEKGRVPDTKPDEKTPDVTEPDLTQSTLSATQVSRP